MQRKAVVREAGRLAAHSGLISLQAAPGGTILLPSTLARPYCQVNGGSYLTLKQPKLFPDTNMPGGKAGASNGLLSSGVGPR